MKKSDSSKGSIYKIPEIIRELYVLVRRLRGICPEREFPLDGLLVGHLGEVVAAYAYDIKLHDAGNHAIVDGVAPGGAEVQIKTTQRDRVNINCARPSCKTLLVLKMHQDGSFTEIYNGDGKRVWDWVKQEREQRKTPLKSPISAVSFRQLEVLKEMIGDGEKIPNIRPLP